MSANEISINKDQDNDILYVIRSDVDRTNLINIGATSDIVLRIDRSTNKIVGITIEDFSKILSDFKDFKDYELMEKFETIIDFLNAPHFSKCIT